MRTIIVSGGNLFQISALYLGDATKWIYIADLNNMTDPFIGSVTTINLPDAANLQAGGIFAG